MTILQKEDADAIVLCILEFGCYQTSRVPLSTISFGRYDDPVAATSVGDAIVKSHIYVSGEGTSL